MSPRVQTLGNLFEHVGIAVQVTPQIQSFEWSKYVAWVCLMAPAVLTHLESYKILQDPQMASITAAIFHEMVQLATTRGMPLHDIPLFPTKTLSQLAFDDTVTHIRQIGDRWASLIPTAKVSTLHDLEQGKRLEVEETLGYAVRQGTALGIPTPTMDTCYKLIAGINHYL
jgi:ketopantoate reductase